MTRTELFAGEGAVRVFKPRTPDLFYRSQGSIPMWSCGKSCGESIPKMIRPSKVSTSERQFRHVVAVFLGRGR